MQGRRIRTGIALGGLLAVAAALIAATELDPPAPRWLRRFLVLWAVLTPYWWWLERRLFAAQEDPATFDADQRHSMLVWLGATLALAALVARG